MEQFCLNAATAEVDVTINALKTTIKFNSPPLNIEIQQEEFSETYLWKLRRRNDDFIVFEWQGGNDQRNRSYKSGYSEAEQKYTSFDLYVDTDGDGNYVFLINIPVIRYFFTDGAGDNTVAFSVDYWIDFEEILLNQIVFSDSESSYTYPLEGLIYKVKCDGCEPGDCKASKSKYPGYVCLDCEKFKNKMISIGRKLDGITRR